ncbi:MAG: hypothetical protein SGI88_12090, partial [Candidatus Hydrogenedentes bacterium]|nr:hypothetical protein [Candidatus Hydrogenedentota bacterium]
MIKFVRASVGIVLAAIFVNAACSRPPEGALVMSKPSIDFGANMLNDTLTVASPFAGANVAVRAEWKCPWLSVAPQQVFTTGPAGPAT